MTQVLSPTAPTAAVEIEIDEERNGPHFFGPLNRRIRGRFDVLRVAEPNAKQLLNKWGQVVPGQRLRVNLATGEAAVVEPLRDDEHLVLREKIAKSGKTLPPAAEVHKLSVDELATWLYWMRRAVESKYARIVAGEFPAELPGKPKLNFLSAERPAKEDKLAAAIESLAAAQREQTTALTAILSKLTK